MVSFWVQTLKYKQPVYFFSFPINNLSKLFEMYYLITCN